MERFSKVKIEMGLIEKIMILEGKKLKLDQKEKKSKYGGKKA